MVFLAAAYLFASFIFVWLGPGAFRDVAAAVRRRDRDRAAAGDAADLGRGEPRGGAPRRGARSADRGGGLQRGRGGGQLWAGHLPSVPADVELGELQLSSAGVLLGAAASDRDRGDRGGGARAGRGVGGSSGLHDGRLDDVRGHRPEGVHVLVHERGQPRVPRVRRSQQDRGGPSGAAGRHARGVGGLLGCLPSLRRSADAGSPSFGRADGGREARSLGAVHCGRRGAGRRAVRDPAGELGYVGGGHARGEAGGSRLLRRVSGHICDALLLGPHRLVAGVRRDRRAGVRG